MQGFGGWGQTVEGMMHLQKENFEMCHVFFCKNIV